MAKQEYEGKYIGDHMSKGYEFAHDLIIRGWNVKVEADTDGSDKYSKKNFIIIKASFNDSEPESTSKPQMLNE